MNKVSGDYRRVRIFLAVNDRDSLKEVIETELELRESAQRVEDASEADVIIFTNPSEISSMVSEDVGEKTSVFLFVSRTSRQLPKGCVTIDIEKDNFRKCMAEIIESTLERISPLLVDSNG
jgi:hypothetical protein